jgi:hypothetical protein
MVDMSSISDRLSQAASLENPDPIRCWETGPHQPNIGRWFPRAQARDGSVVVLVNLKIAAVDVNGDEFAIILCTNGWTYPLFEDVLPKGGQFIKCTTAFAGWHGRSSQSCSPIISYSLQGNQCFFMIAQSGFAPMRLKWARKPS